MVSGKLMQQETRARYFREACSPARATLWRSRHPNTVRKACLLNTWPGGPGQGRAGLPVNLDWVLLTHPHCHPDGDEADKQRPLELPVPRSPALLLKRAVATVEELGRQKTSQSRPDLPLTTPSLPKPRILTFQG